MTLLWPRAPLPELRSRRLLARLPQPSDFPRWQDARLSSRETLEPYEPKWSDTDHTRRMFIARTKRIIRQARAGTDYSFLIFFADQPKGEVLGGITLSNVRYAVARQANLGYWMNQHFAGQGIMTECVACVLQFSFDHLQLNRIHAAFVPQNTGSRRVLAKNHFVEEGFAAQYLRINGSWQDHVLCGLTRDQWRLNSRPV